MVSSKDVESETDKPDIMNDAAYATNGGRGGKHIDEPNSCRICRSEGTPEGPLFYPCRCSGSIKFVHQECLMEWLSHSQKKHCELCKTPFRFTKLYHPQMPQSLPIPVFLRHLVTHSVKTMLTWFRALLVSFVWLGWLPWAMRVFWRALFWLGDGGWASWQDSVLQIAPLSDPVSSTVPLAASVLSLASATTKDFIARETMQEHLAKTAVLNMSSLLFPVSQTLNSSAGEPAAYAFLKKLLLSFSNTDNSAQSEALRVFNSTVKPTSFDSDFFSAPQTQLSWLSNFQFLRNLTRSSKTNGLIIDVLEGQIITISVVIAFILIFLIREWVVQQQPGINMQAGPILDPPGRQPDEEGALVLLARQDALRRLEGFRARNADPEGPEGGDRPAMPPAASTQQSQVDAPLSADDTILMVEGSENPSRPNITRNALNKPMVVQLIASEETRKWSCFVEFWERSGRDSLETLRLIREEKTGEDLEWMLEVAERLMDVDVNRKNSKPRSTSASHGGDEPDHLSDKSNGSWQNVQNTDTTDHCITTLYSPGSTGGPSPRVSNSNAVNNDERNDDMEDKSDSHCRSQEAQSSIPSALNKGKGREAEQNDTDSLQRVTSAHATPVELTDSSLHVAGPSETSPHSDDNRRRKPNDPDPEDLSELNRGVGIETYQPRPAGDHDQHPSTVTEANNPFHPDYLDEARNQVLHSTSSHEFGYGNEYAVALAESQVSGNPAPAPRPSRSVAESVMDWMYKGIVPTETARNEGHENDAHVIRDLAAEAPFVPRAHAAPDGVQDPHAVEHPAQNEEVVAAAANDGLEPDEPDVVDEIEDFEGVMELIGMRGPLLGLVQNGVFSAVLIVATVTGGVWIPYCWGKAVLLLMSDPILYLIKVPLLAVSALADLTVDFLLLAISSSTWCINYSLGWVLTPLCEMFPWITKYTYNTTMTATTSAVIDASLERIAKVMIATGDNFLATDFPMFSILSHEALRLMQSRIATAFQSISHMVMTLCDASILETSQFWLHKLQHTVSTTNIALSISSMGRSCIEAAYQIPSLARSIAKSNILRISLHIQRRATPVDLDLAYWGTKDRIIAILAGYVCFAIVGALYLKKGRLFTTSENGKKIEGFIIDILQQAGGVLKVILIISIEMIVFPLYCGLLLDFALLPLFESATFMSRINFAAASPWTSAFVHWFVGTCYMFHFALFVSMCRKIMRSGVLYFIRDPDDPTFHPVREVLERNVSNQLRKITFSALVYGALVVVCLGGVVWGLFYAFDGVLPIHWSSNEPVWEFPVDLVFYNFLMPLAVKLYKPSDGLHTIYNWWFRVCARTLRLTQFLFGEQHHDEEGHHAWRTWWSFFARGFGYVNQPIIGEDRKVLSNERDTDTNFLRDGRYVRAPASDQVRIPKGGRVFLEVNESNQRLDGQPDRSDGLHGRYSDLFTKVYIPPWFRVRIGLFVLAVWAFAAATGIGVTIIPLVLGRIIFATIIPNHLRMNDVYAFSIGIYILAGVFYAVSNSTKSLAYLRDRLVPQPGALKHALLKAYKPALRILRVCCVYGAFTLLLPSLIACFMEAYLIIPLHTYLAPDEQHVVHFVQDWTLGVLYLKIAGRFLLWHDNTRPAYALRAIVRNGWLDPNMTIAMRCFILPALVIASTVIGSPLLLGWIVNNTVFWGLHPLSRSNVYRFCYPAVALSLVGMLLGWAVSACVATWKAQIRDEAYLIGERLHNYGERKERKRKKGGKVKEARVEMGAGGAGRAE